MVATSEFVLSDFVYIPGIQGEEKYIKNLLNNWEKKKKIVSINELCAVGNHFQLCSL